MNNFGIYKFYTAIGNITYPSPDIKRQTNLFPGILYDKNQTNLR